MWITQSVTQVEQAVAALQPLSLHEQSKTLAQMVFDGALTATEGTDVLHELARLSLAQPQPDPSMWRLTLQS